MAGIPAIFLFVSAVEMGLGMWQYHTLAQAMKDAARYTISHGQGCLMTGNSCSTTIGAISTYIADAAIGIPASSLNVTFTSASGAVQNCAPLNTCFNSTTVWPPSSNGDNLQGANVSISGAFTLEPSMAMFWPGTRGVNFDSVTLTASSTQQVMF